MFLLVAGDLLLGSGGSEGSRKTEENDLLALGMKRDINLFRRPTFVKRYARNLIPDGSKWPNQDIVTQPRE